MEVIAMKNFLRRFWWVIVLIVLVGVGGYFGYAKVASPLLAGVEETRSGVEELRGAVVGKADQAALEELAAKTTDELSRKAGTEELKSLAETVKAGEEYVDEELAKKANTEYVDAELTKRASKNDLATLRTEFTGSVKALKADLADKADAEVVTDLQKQLKAARAEARKAKKLAEALKADADAARVAQPEPVVASPEPAPVAQPAAEPPQERVTIRWEPTPVQ
ncbi:MAG: hypothetical protein V1902_03870 [Candidatus Falkowbacteria bacterium]